MKSVILFLLLFSTAAKAQSIALLDLRFKTPVTYTDSVSLETFTKSVFPLYTQDIKPVMKAIEEVRKKMAQNKYDFAEVHTVRIGHSVLILQTEKGRRTRKCSLTLSTAANGYAAYINLLRGDYDRAAQQRIVAFLDYLRNNTAIAEDAALVRK